jgi:hypothetical protein
LSELDEISNTVEITTIRLKTRPSTNVQSSNVSLNE